MTVLPINKWIIFLIILTGLQACTPTNNTPLPTPTPKLIANSYSFSNATADNQTRDTLRFDPDSNLISVSYTYINGLAPYQTIDSGTYYFILDPGTKLPVSYILTGRKYFYTQDMIEKHVLTYDNQNRVILDSMTENNTSGYSPMGAHFSYSSDLILVNIYYAGQADYTRQDSIFLDVNENWYYRSEYYYDGTNWSKEFSYSLSADRKFAHPFYNTNLSKSLGAFAVYSNIADLLSKNLTNSANLLPMTWITDARGRVISGTNAQGVLVKYTYLN
jgi:hypothetical protein